MSEAEMTPEMRMAIIRSVISSQMLSGVELSLEDAERLFDEAMPMLTWPGDLLDE